MTLEQYLKDRWEKLTPESRQLLGFNDPFSRNVLRIMWEKQYYQAEIKRMVAEIDELKQEVKRLWPETKEK